MISPISPSHMLSSRQGTVVDGHGSAASDYRRELDRIGSTIAELEPDALAADVERATRFAYACYQRASLTGDLEQLRAAEGQIDAAIGQFGSWPDLWFLKASLDLKLHRLERVRLDLARVAGLATSADATALLADVDLQQGRYEDARRGYQKLIRETRAWDAIARLAHLEGLMGDDALADRLYEQAIDEITAKELRSYAWVELQRGALHLSRGRYDEAEDHYRRGEAAYSGYWMTAEHVAKLRAAQGRLDEAIALYEGVVAHLPRPDLQHALGDLYLLAGAPDRAEIWHAGALAGYLESVDRGDVHFYHHLVDFYADVRKDGGAAVIWARKDLALRPSFATESALGWALYRDGRFAEAVAMIQTALASGARSPHLLRTAGIVYQAAGRVRDGERLLAEAAAMNPHHRHFHVHH